MNQKEKAAALDRLTNLFNEGRLIEVPKPGPITEGIDCGDHVEGRICEHDPTFVCGKKQCRSRVYWPAGKGYARKKKGAPP